MFSHDRSPLPERGVTHRRRDPDLVIACYELIEMITQHNNMAQFEPALIMRWIFKTAVSVSRLCVTNTCDIS